MKQIRTMLNNWEKSGYEYAQSKFLEHYHPTKKTKGEPHIEIIISGKLDYLKMVKGEKDRTYLKLKNRYDQLLGSIVTNILDVWEKDGIEEAIELYEKTIHRNK